MFDGGFDLDLEAVKENIAEAEVVTFYFPLLRQTLLIDTRKTDSDGPLVCIVPIARSSTDRFDSLSKLRPAFPRPESITMIPWSRRVDSLRSAGVWDALLLRLRDLGGEEFVRDAAACLHDLLKAESQELLHAITGEQYHTVWGPARSSRA